MNIISGGLNKPKSTGQQTIPVLAGDKERTNISEDIKNILKILK
jgi:glutathionyl-hydroquinone reductase